MILDAKRIFVHLSPFNISIYLIYLSIYLSIFGYTKSGMWGS